MSSLTAPAERIPSPAGIQTSNALFVALPFLFPFAAGPSVNIWQLLASWSCAALFLAFGDANFVDGLELFVDGGMGQI